MVLHLSQTEFVLRGINSNDRARAKHLQGSGIDTRIVQFVFCSVNQKYFQNFLPIFKKMH